MAWGWAAGPTSRWTWGSPSFVPSTHPWTVEAASPGERKGFHFHHDKPESWELCYYTSFLILSPTNLISKSFWNLCTALHQVCFYSGITLGPHVVIPHQFPQLQAPHFCFWYADCVTWQTLSHAWPSSFAWQLRKRFLPTPHRWLKGWDRGLKWSVRKWSWSVFSQDSVWGPCT